MNTEVTQSLTADDGCLGRDAGRAGVIAGPEHVAWEPYGLARGSRKHERHRFPRLHRVAERDGSLLLTEWRRSRDPFTASAVASALSIDAAQMRLCVRFTISTEPPNRAIVDRIEIGAAALALSGRDRVPAPERVLTVEFENLESLHVHHLAAH